MAETITTVTEIAPGDVADEAKASAGMEHEEAEAAALLRIVEGRQEDASDTQPSGNSIASRVLRRYERCGNVSFLD